MVSDSRLLRKTFPIYEQLAKQLLKKEKEVPKKDKDFLKNCIRVCLLNAGLCQLFKGDVITIAASLERYQALDPTFEGMHECKLLKDLAAAMKRKDVKKFDVLVNEFNINSMRKLPPWETTILLTVSHKLTTIEKLEQSQAALFQLLLQVYRGDTVATTQSLEPYLLEDASTSETLYYIKWLSGLLNG